MYFLLVSVPLKLPTQSALDQIYTGKWAVPFLVVFIQQILVNGFVSDLFKLARALPNF